MKLTFSHLLAAGILCVLLGQTDGQLSFGFACRRNGAVCLGTGSTCDTTCECATGRIGHQCGEVEIDPDCSALTCGEGKCKGAPGSETCVCSAGFYFHPMEQTCVARTSVSSCTATNIIMKVVPNTQQFDGLIYINGKDNVAECVFKPIVENGITGYTLDLAYSSVSCGAVEEDGTKKGYTVVVQYGDIFNNLDQSVTFRCDIPADGAIITSTSGSVVVDPVDTSSDIESTTVQTDSESGLTLRVIQGTGADIAPGQTFRVGTPMKLQVELDTTKGFNYVMLWKLTAKSDTKEVVFIKEGCAKKVAMPVSKSLTTVEPSDKYVIEWEFTLFQFPREVTVLFETEVMMCAGDSLLSTACEPRGCGAADDISGVSSINNGYGRRRKRQDSTGTLVEKKMAVTVYVQGPDIANGISNSLRQYEVNKTDCLKSMGFLVPIIALPVLLLVATLVAIFFCLKAMQAKNYEGSQSKLAYTS